MEKMFKHCQNPQATCPRQLESSFIIKNQESSVATSTDDAHQIGEQPCKLATIIQLNTSASFIISGPAQDRDITDN